MTSSQANFLVEQAVLNSLLPVILRLTAHALGISSSLLAPMCESVASDRDMYQGWNGASQEIPISQGTQINASENGQGCEQMSMCIESGWVQFQDNVNARINQGSYLYEGR